MAKEAPSLYELRLTALDTNPVFQRLGVICSALPNCESISIFRENILQFIRPARTSIYNCHNPKGI